MSESARKCLWATNIREHFSHISDQDERHKIAFKSFLLSNIMLIKVIEVKSHYNIIVQCKIIHDIKFFVVSTKW